MSATTRWDVREYQRIASVSRHGDELVVQFEDGSRVNVDAQRILPADTRLAQWDAMTFNPYEIVVPTLGGEVEVPWSIIRVLTDKEYSAYLAGAAEEEARQIGLRIKELRTNRNLSSKELAERASITPQSLSRIEHGRHDVVFTTLQRLLAAMGYTLKDLAVAPRRPASVTALLRRLASVGIDRDLVLFRLLPEWARNQATGHTGVDDEETVIEQIARGVSRVFNWSVPAILGNEPLQFDPALIPTTRFKVRGRVNELRATAYTFYAHFLALTVLEAMPRLEPRPVPADPDELRQEVIAKYGSLDFEHLLRFAWDCGIPVIPLRDPGMFHGACWRVSGRSIVVLKQMTDSQARWLYDLLHELKHVASHLSDERPAVIESAEISPILDQYKVSDEEWEASEFASEVVLFGRAEELAKECVVMAQGSVEQLKRAVQRVAAVEHVPADALANYLAFRLMSGNKINWWGAANNLQVTDPPPWQTARDLLLERVELERLNIQDRDLLLRALSEPEEN